jgi:hypothetical protein
VDQPSQVLKIEKENISIFAKKKKVMKKYSRDLSKPLAPSYGSDDPSFKKQIQAAKQANKLKKIQAKGDIQAKNVSEGKNKSGATKGSGVKKMVSGVSTTLGLTTAVMGLVKGVKK